MDMQEQETINGIRMSWNIWPNSKYDMNQIVIPLGCIYTPLKTVDDLKLAAYEPLQCKSSAQCSAFLNPYCYIDFRNKMWTCNFCGYRQQFPPFYAENISEQQLPMEKMYPTLEYLLPQSICQPPVFFFLLDTALNNPEDESEFRKAKECLQQLLQTIPQSSLVAFISFGLMVQLYELGFQELSKSYAFSGYKAYSPQQVAATLGLGNRNDPRGTTGRTEAARRFLCTVQECEFTLNAILDDLRHDRWPRNVAIDRTQRCTGAALNIAVSLLEHSYAGHAGRIVVMTSGPCTIGPGAVVGQDKAEAMRSHLDITKDHGNARYSKPAKQFYNDVAMRAVGAGHAVDIFACSLDQTGLHEMRTLVDRTGGVMVMADAFSTHVFRDSFQKMLTTLDESGFLDMGFNARITTMCSREYKVCGAIGNISSAKRKHPSVCETSFGEGSTVEWSIGVVDRNTSIAFYFEVNAPGGPSEEGENQSGSGIRSSKPIQQSQAAYLQLQTIYNHPSGKKRIRVTTVARAFADPELYNISSSFDQEAAAVLMARFCINQIESGESFDVMRRLDRILIRLISKFAQYNKNDPGSFNLAEEFTLFPQFMFYLRRSPFLEMFNSSPDETAFYRSNLMREGVMNSLVMIQPALMEYSFESSQPRPVLLDSRSLKKNVILLLDTFFHVVIWRGETVQQWYDAGYHEHPDHENFKNLLQVPAEDAKTILEERFPVPKYVQTYSNGSQARFLLSRVNPSRTYKEELHNPSDGSSVIMTDDVSLRNFMEVLIKYAVGT